MGLINWLFSKVAEKVADKEYGPGQTAFRQVSEGSAEPQGEEEPQAGEEKKD